MKKNEQMIDIKKMREKNRTRFVLERTGQPSAIGGLAAGDRGASARSFPSMPDLPTRSLPAGCRAVCQSGSGGKPVGKGKWRLGGGGGV